ncbi:hypothetical protein [Planctomicrobium piriforme]|uniref:Tetratricopeptide repeat-containing protein n=1 Tax=Planctomicrobium piriforme TaxID=1576369 RepID=A0A1I3JWF2_9PLAN|nr:hypothetical protein [Planctomicrobium piriforme]SFI64587.1 hypothetical protein SAMN05421753_11137 [Planctomicrobium piriforme]
MLRNLLLAAWLMTPIGGYLCQQYAAPELIKSNQASAAFSQASMLTQQEDWESAVAVLLETQALVPEKDVRTQNQLKLEIAKLYLRQGMLDDARDALVNLGDKLATSTSEQAPDQFRREYQRVMANTDFYTAWQLRVQGEVRDTWEPVLDGARQSFRQLAETANTDAERTSRAEDNESAIRLAFLDDEDLIGTPFPKKCQCKSKCKNPSKKKPKKLEEPKDSAGQGEDDPDTTGT